MARQHKVIYGGGLEGEVDQIDAIFAEYPRTASVDSFSPINRGERYEWVALVSWDEAAEAVRPKAMR